MDSRLPAGTDAKHAHTHLAVDAHAESGEALRVVAISTVGMLAVGLFQLAIYLLSQSAGLLSDALHNLGDVLTTAALYLAFLLVRRGATRHYPWGYGRAEDLAGAFIGLVIAGSAILAGWESIQHLLHNTVPTLIGWGILAALVGAVGNEALAEYKVRAGRRLHSQALIAEGQHSRADGLTSAAAAVGLALTWLGWKAADPVAGIVIAVAILFILADVARGLTRHLMDGVEPQVREQIIAVASTVPGVVAVTEARARWAGRGLFISLIITADASLSLIEAHAIAEHVRLELLERLPGAAIVDVHVDPAGARDETHGHAVIHRADSTAGHQLGTVTTQEGSPDHA